MDIALLIALSVHTVAFVIAWGYYGVMARMVIPGLRRTLDPPLLAQTLASIEGRARPLVILSVVLFVTTGTYLLVVDPQYGGLGNVRSGWTALMLLKHLVVVLLVISGVVFDVLMRWLAEEPEDDTRLSTLRWARWTAETATVLGAVIVLLTVAAQLSV